MLHGMGGEGGAVRVELKRQETGCMSPSPRLLLHSIIIWFDGLDKIYVCGEGNRVMIANQAHVNIGSRLRMPV